MKNTVLIVYGTGQYGTYLEWVLSTMFNDVPVKPPFTNLGNSHLYNGFHPRTIDDWVNYTNDDKEYQFARIHPKFEEFHSIQDNLDLFCKTAKKIVLLYPDEQTKLLAMNNEFTKVEKNYFKDRFSRSIDPSIIYSNWPVDSKTPIDQLPRWVMREFLSLYFVPAWESEHEYPLNDNVYCENCCLVSLSDLLYNFKKSIQKILDYTELSYNKTVDDMISSHALMLSKQANISQDKIVEDILQSVHNDVDHSWLADDIGLISESYIQWALRTAGYQLRCEGLDNFPTSSIKLKELCYLDFVTQFMNIVTK